MEQCSTFGLLIYHSSSNTYMMDIPILLLLAALAGAILNVVRGYLNTEKPFAPRKLVGAIIAACITAIALVSVFDVSTLGGPVQMVILGLMSGFGSDFALSRLNK
tara:strand:- start:1767 stop:2081 length:315 start_codon:yes stop_codon:yes gene_type:complete